MHILWNTFKLSMLSSKNFQYFQGRQRQRVKGLQLTDLSEWVTVNRLQRNEAGLWCRLCITLWQSTGEWNTFKLSELISNSWQNTRQDKAAGLMCLRQSRSTNANEGRRVKGLGAVDVRSSLCFLELNSVVDSGEFN